MSKSISYKNLAEKYNIFHRQEKEYLDLQLEKMKRYLFLNNENYILDVGCGAGRLLYPLSHVVREIHGVEKSIDMFNVCNENLPKNAKIFNVGFEEFNNDIKYDAIYFSMSLHQMENQYDLLLKAMNMLKDNGRLLLITVSHEQFKEILLNHYFPSIDVIDKNRFLDIGEIHNFVNDNNFNLELKEENTIYSTLNKDDFLNRLKSKYISTLQLISDEELEEGISMIDEEYDSEIIVPDCYTYLVIKK